ncbi:NAD(+) synthase [Patescibacteria group bacterium]|nr:NAD(+) synthase [Patescibacteria group bacterium]MBU4481388.1 NAD(+) synthase [Patescibacteria group bacterium]
MRKNIEEEIANIHRAVVFGIRDYFKKSGFKEAILGLSGGIDSSVTACLAVRALGKKNVLGVNLPSPYSSKEGIADAKKLAKNLGIKLKILPINSIYQVYLEFLKNYLGKKMSVAKENIQARIRTNILMALANKTGALVLCTGNKSELVLGYCTLYGDLAGGLAPISDLTKSKVYQLAEYINSKKEIIPHQILERPPTPELKPGQLTEKELFPYKILDPIIELYLEKGSSEKEIIKRGFPSKLVKWVIERIKKNEYKTKQAPPGLRVTSKAFGIGRRMPIATKYDFDDY